MDVYVQSRVPDVDGTVTVSTAPIDTVASLIQTFCHSKHIPKDRHYQIQNEGGLVLNKKSTVKDCGLFPSAIVYLIKEDPIDTNLLDSDGWKKRKVACSYWWIVAIATLLIGGGGLIAVAIVRCKISTQPYEYGIVFDAGSSHTDMYIYKWSGTYTNGTAVIKQIHSCHGQAITTHLATPSKAGDVLKPCLYEAQKVIPHSRHKGTHVYLGATAGMRLLHLSEPLRAKLIMVSVRDTIKSYPFVFTNETSQARILSGKEEGTFGWIASNYLANTLAQNEAMNTFGALDMGGASTEITFIPEDSAVIPDDYRYDVKLYGTRYSMYSHSYLCYGVNEAWRMLLAHLVLRENNSTNLTNPCAPSGNSTRETYDFVFKAPCTDSHLNRHTHLRRLLEEHLPSEEYEFTGTSEPEECSEAVSGLFRSGNCTHPPCTFDGVFQPHVRGRFMAFSTYFYLSEFLNLTSPNVTLEQYRRAIRDFCSKSWSEIKDMPTSYRQGLARFCFEGVFFDTILTHAYNFTELDWDTIQFTDTVGGSEVGWAMGFMLVETRSIPEELPPKIISDLLFSLLVVLFIFILAVSIGLACYAKRQSGHGNTAAGYVIL